MPPQQQSGPMSEFTEALATTLVQASRGPLNDCVAAIRGFENMADAHRKTARMFDDKAEDEISHAERIKAVLAKSMKAQGVSEISGDGCLVTMVLGPNGAETVKIS